MDAADRASTNINGLVEPLAAVLDVWDRLGLEIGEAAVVSDGHPLSRLAALAASWYGARVILIPAGGSDDVPPHATRLDTADPDAALTTLTRLLSESPGTAAAELSGRPEVVDLLLEALPASSRLLLAGRQRERLTIDFYVNVHRKGLLLLSSVLEPPAAGAIVTSPASVRARRLLARSDRTAQCRNALDAGARVAAPGVRGQ